MTEPDTEQAVRNASWWLTTALDRLATDRRRYDSRLKGRLDTARAALGPAVAIAQPKVDAVDGR